MRKYIAIGYAVTALLTGGIVFIYLHEWHELERIEAESKEMNMLRLEATDAPAWTAITFVGTMVQQHLQKVLFVRLGWVSGVASPKDGQL